MLVRGLPGPHPLGAVIAQADRGAQGADEPGGEEREAGKPQALAGARAVEAAAHTLNCRS